MWRNILVASFVIAFGAGKAEAAWTEQQYKELGYSILFPKEPTVSTASYRTQLVPGAVTHIYSANDANTNFTATIVDLMDRGEEGASILIEAEFNLDLIGDVVLNSTTRVENGRDASYGRLLTLDCRRGIIPDQPGQTETAHTWFKNITGLDCPDGARMLVTMYFRAGRMYLFSGMNLPVNGDAIRPAAIQFVQSVSFTTRLPGAAAAAGGGRGAAGGGRGAPVGN